MQVWVDLSSRPGQGEQGVTNVVRGKILLKQFPADTAQWGLSLPAIVCISIQLLASCSPTTTTTTTTTVSVGIISTRLPASLSPLVPIRSSLSSPSQSSLLSLLGLQASLSFHCSLR